MSDTPNPKLFVSYSWSNADHQGWVVQLATELRSAGVDVILDKWDLREGHDANAFMERMVNDPNIKKVILICDQIYATKANRRSGGVGVETQIVTPEIYKSQDQSKFVAVIRERDEIGNPCVPAYYSSRIYIDLSDPSTYAVEFERLLRWLYDRPLHKKPDLGGKPAFLSETESTIHLPTAVTFRRAVDAIRNGRPQAIPALQEYFDLVSQQMERFRIIEKGDPFDERVAESVKDFLPYRNELIEIFSTVALYRDDDETISTIHKFFESLIPYLYRPVDVRSWNDTDFDNFKFIIQELFIYCIACLLKRERFDAIGNLLRREFYVRSEADFGRDAMTPFSVLQSYIKSLEARNHRLKLGRRSLAAELLNERCKGIGVEFDKLMTADFILFMRSKIDQHEGHSWWPDTLVYVGRFAGHFEVFARCKSRSFFNKLKIALGVNSKDDLEAALQAIEAAPGGIPRWDFGSFSPRVLLGFETISTKP